MPTFKLDPNRLRPVEMIKVNRWGFQKSICLCFVISVACVSALVSVKFNSHLFLLQCLIKESHILIDEAGDAAWTFNKCSGWQNVCSSSLKRENVEWGHADLKRSLRLPDWWISGCWNNGGLHPLVFDTLTPPGLIVEGFVVFAGRGGGGTVLFGTIVFSGQWASGVTQLPR